MDIRKIKGVAEKRALLLEKMGMHTVEDVLYDFPRRYVDRTKVAKLLYTIPDGEILLKARVVNKYVSRNRVFLDIATELARAKIVFMNARFLESKIQSGEEYYFFGSAKDGTLFNPEFSDAIDDNFLRIVPIYRLTEGLKSAVAEKIHIGALELVDFNGESVKEWLPDFVFEERPNMMTLGEAIQTLHQPKSFDAIERAKKRIVFGELFSIFCNVLASKKRESAEPAKKITYSSFKKMPFSLTNSQKKAIAEIKGDLESGHTMNRIVNGDVGSGKTVVAYVAARMAIESGYQVLFMAPTTVLAKQLYEGYVNIFGKETMRVGGKIKNQGGETSKNQSSEELRNQSSENFKNQSEDIQNKQTKACVRTVYFLSSKQTAAEKQEIYVAAENGQAEIVFGTHAVLSDKLVFQNLALVITDEQQRFGIVQRETALQKANIKHNLYLTATPIPRTLAMTFFADMDISKIEEMPKGRMPITTKFVDSEVAPKMISFIQQKIDEGGQAYFVVPTIQNGKSNLKAVSKRLKEVLDAEIGMVHGELKPETIEKTMADFKDGKIDVLVATTIVEVGVDNPNANVMVILESERFGLSQLHQLRGRVGRGNRKSYCFLMSRGELTERIETIINNADGFSIAEKDLEIRGPGTFLGSEQSGKFKISYPFSMEDLKSAHQAAVKFQSIS